jgi:predicted flap endonuclease-1-like 5' DNA nuclease
MTVFIIQTILLLAVSYILGCIFGCWLHRLFGIGDRPAFVQEPAVVPVPIPGATMTASAAEPVAFAAPPAVKAQTVQAQTAKPAPKAAPAAKSVAKPAALVSEPKPKAAAKPKPAAVAAPAKKDDLKRISGIGRQNEARLNAFGVTAFEQIAAWSKKEQEDYGEKLAFPGRIEREEWVKQAKVLAKGGATVFAKRVDAGAVATSTGKGATGDMGKQPKQLEKARRGKPDNLTLIDGVGNAIEKRLFELGFFHFDQIAKLSDAEATWLGIAVGFPGRVQRENWVAEAKTLAAGGSTAHARKVERGEIETSHATKGGKSASASKHAKQPAKQPVKQPGGKPGTKPRPGKK